ncbi:MAG: alpha/beta hydrolase [Candidatus Diapherotrites archaeon]|uniref:Alpha/beta hydrolase n=1 Tax=Candidatus Iainarchaeum sp. TaxID=3101447 RepID=A0A8T4C6G5_9ARCH|nr:alpha/beta hydrolase [Candidatus Diapherotrites archaeon]
MVFKGWTVVVRMKAQFLRIFAKDGIELHGIIYSPEKPTRKVVLHVHGMAGNFYENKFLDQFASQLTAKGIAFVSFNNRGHDFIADFALKSDPSKTRRIGMANEKFEECVLDIEPWVDYLEKEGFTEIFLQGHSLGCSKVPYYVAQKLDKRIKAVILLAAADMIKLGMRGTAYAEWFSRATKMQKEGRGSDLLPGKWWDWNIMSANTFLNFFTKGNEIDVIAIDSKNNSILSKITVPILTVLGDKDEIIIHTPQKDVQIMKELASKCPRFDSKIIAGADHHFYPFEKEVVGEVVKWILIL